ncbi:MAG: methyltransferase [Pseudomonadales bacterium]
MSRDICFDLIFDALSTSEGNVLWVLDENPPLNAPAAQARVTVICNRFDAVEQLERQGWNVIFSDFDFTHLPSGHYSTVIYRLSKEKALAHFVINSAHALLAPGGRLIISGAKQEGIKGYLDRTAKRYTQCERWKADKQHWAGAYDVTAVGPALDDKDYPQLRSIGSESGLEFFSKPGVFGWNKFDKGSQLLIEHVKALNLELSHESQVLDLGCGYGYLSLWAANLFKCEITATDNSATALLACAQSLQSSGVKHQLIAANAGHTLQQSFDLILCNPPFHTGFDVENDLTEVFLKSAARVLKTGARALFVVNLHIPLERKAQAFFTHIKLLSDNPHFKVIELAL